VIDRIQRVKEAIEAVVAKSRVPEDPVHSKNTLAWLLRLKPDADEALKIAALGHDIERAIERRKVRRADFDDYEKFKAAHARNSALVLREIMQKCGLTAVITDDVCRLVCRHEVGGDEPCNLLKDADSISYFEVNLPLYFEREGYSETQRRTIWGYRRLSAGVRRFVRTITYETDSLNILLRETILAADDGHPTNRPRSQSPRRSIDSSIASLEVDKYRDNALVFVYLGEFSSHQNLSRYDRKEPVRTGPLPDG